MLPEFDDSGNLPPGIHACALAELELRFGGEERQAHVLELADFVATAKAAGVRRLLVNGSFVTNKPAPNDVDVVILPGTGYPRSTPKLDDEELAWPFLHIIVAADDADFEAWALRTFATDRLGQPKGVVEIAL